MKETRINSCPNLKTIFVNRNKTRLAESRGGQGDEGNFLRNDAMRHVTRAYMAVRWVGIALGTAILPRQVRLHCDYEPSGLLTPKPFGFNRVSSKTNFGVG